MQVGTVRNMKKQYVQVMKKRGYRQEWVKEPYIFTRNEALECYVVLLTEQALSEELLQKKRQQLEEYYFAQGYSQVYQLCIICQKDGVFSEELLALVEQAPNVWLIAEDQNRVYQYEHQPLEFDGLCQMFEGLPPGQKQPILPFTKESFPYVTLILVLINVFCFLFPMLTGQHEAWIDAGGNYWAAVLEQREAYRLWSYMFLHLDVRHLFNNMLVLCAFGMLLEPVLGHGKYGVLYLSAGFVSGILSFLVNLVWVEHVISIGASGAVFGLAGALLALALFRKNRVPGLSARRMILLVMISLYSGYTTPRVDNVGHIGGLLTGFVLMLIISFVESLFPADHPFNRNNCT